MVLGYQRRNTLSENEYKTVAGIIQFEPETREVNGKAVKQFTVRNIAGNVNVRVTIWPELAAPALEKGDGVMVDGKYTTTSSQDGSREFHNISATTIVKLGTGTAKASNGPAVVQRSAASEPAF